MLRVLFQAKWFPDSMSMSTQLGWTFCRQVCNQARSAGVSPHRAQGTKFMSQDEENKTSPGQAAKLKCHAQTSTALRGSQPMKPNTQFCIRSHQLRHLCPNFGHDTPNCSRISHNTYCWEKRCVFKSHCAQWRIPPQWPSQGSCTWQLLLEEKNLLSHPVRSCTMCTENKRFRTCLSPAVSIHDSPLKRPLRA